MRGRGACLSYLSGGAKYHFYGSVDADAVGIDDEVVFACVALLSAGIVSVVIGAACVHLLYFLGSLFLREV